MRSKQQTQNHKGSRKHLSDTDFNITMLNNTQEKTILKTLAEKKITKMKYTEILKLRNTITEINDLMDEVSLQRKLSGRENHCTEK